jgi:hypothetical protein
MLPPWMIERLEQDRREREAREQPRLEIEIRPPSDERPRTERPATSTGSGVTIQVW